jgi:hypothetical protein
MPTTVVPKMISFIKTLAIVKMAPSELERKSVDSSPFSTMSRIGHADRSEVDYEMTEETM